MVEFALAAPILIFMLMALMEVGHGINSYLSIIAAARDAARYGSASDDNSDNYTAMLNMVDKETERLANGGPPTGAQNCASTGQGVCISSTTVDSTDAIRVRVCYNHQLIIGLPSLMSGPLRMCSTTEMRVANGT